VQLLISPLLAYQMSRFNTHWTKEEGVKGQTIADWQIVGVTVKKLQVQVE
jgi:hypothetical protein